MTSHPIFLFFKKAKKLKGKQQENQDGRSSEATTVTSQVTVAASSPSSKCLSRRAQCIDQLSKWHLLLEAGGITQAQYEELKEFLMI